MSTLSLRLPDSLHERIKHLSKAEGVSINQFITLALTEKMSALMTLDYLEQRARRSSQKKFKEALRAIPDVEPEDYDKL